MRRVADVRSEQWVSEHQICVGWSHCVCCTCVCVCIEEQQLSIKVGARWAWSRAGAWSVRAVCTARAQCARLVIAQRASCLLAVPCCCYRSLCVRPSCAPGTRSCTRDNATITERDERRTPSCAVLYVRLAPASACALTGTLLLRHTRPSTHTHRQTMHHLRSATSTTVVSLQSALCQQWSVHQVPSLEDYPSPSCSPSPQPQPSSNRWVDRYLNLYCIHLCIVCRSVSHYHSPVTSRFVTVPRPFTLFVRPCALQ